MDAVLWYAELESQCNFLLNFICVRRRTTRQTYDIDRTWIGMACDMKRYTRYIPKAIFLILDIPGISKYIFFEKKI